MIQGFLYGKESYGKEIKKTEVKKQEELFERK